MASLKTPCCVYSSFWWWDKMWKGYRRGDVALGDGVRGTWTQALWYRESQYVNLAGKVTNRLVVPTVWRQWMKQRRLFQAKGREASGSSNSCAILIMNWLFLELSVWYFQTRVGYGLLKLCLGGDYSIGDKEDAQNESLGDKTRPGF